jgi:hypothetical protein
VLRVACFEYGRFTLPPALSQWEPAYAQKLPPTLGSYGGQDGGHGGRMVASWFGMLIDQCGSNLDVF